MRKVLLAGLLLSAPMVMAPLIAQPIDPMANDKVASYDWVRPQADFVRRTEMVPMREPGLGWWGRERRDGPGIALPPLFEIASGLPKIFRDQVGPFIGE